jgi:hypothetical protein|eukprot:COSAG01_NODE_9009_length_2583_cov_6.595008_2_plen_89_part_00
MDGCECAERWLAQIIVALLSIVGAIMLMTSCTSSYENGYGYGYGYGYYTTETREDKKYEDIAIIALILTIVALFYGIYMIVAGCVPVR